MAKLNLKDETQSDAPTFVYFQIPKMNTFGNNAQNAILEVNNVIERRV